MNRLEGIGGTDIGAIIGVNPWKKPIDVYMEKLKLTEPQDDNENMWWGREMEPIIKKRYEQDTGFTVTATEPIRHELYGYFVGSPDGLIGMDGGVDFKTTGYSDSNEWGEPGSDEIPAYIHTQGTWYMGLTGREWWDIAVLFMGRRREFRIYRIERDDELIQILIEKARHFCENYLIPKIPPPIDAAAGWKKFFNFTYPQEKEDMIDSTMEIDDIIFDLKYINDAMSKLTEESEALKNKLKSVIGNHAGINSLWGKITWKKNKDTVATDWKSAYFDLCEYCHEKNLIINDDDFSGKHTTIKPGARVFRPYFNKEVSK